MTLPDGWVLGTFDDVIEVTRGVTFSKGQRRDAPLEGFVPCLRSGNVQANLTTEPLIFVPESVVKSSDRYIRPGDAIVSMSNSYELVGKVAQASDDHSGMTFGAFLSAFRSDILESSLLYHLLRSPKLQADMRATASQTVNISNLSISGLANLRIPIPPLAEQRCIVAKLDALTARLARARAELDRVPVLVRSLRATALAGAYERLSYGAPTSPISDMVASLDQGWSPKCEKSPSQSDDQWGVLKTTAIQALEFRPGENKALPADLKPRPKIAVAEGDILVTRAGPRVRCGITCLIDKTRPRLMLADKMYRLRAKPDRARPDYLAMMLNAPQVLAIIDDMKTGISDSGLNLTQEKFLSVPIPTVDLDTQSRAVAELSIAFARADRLEAEATRARALLDRLESALLAKAFRGELVPQDPNDEPASVLLDRIRAERVAAPKTKRGRRKSAN